MTQTFSLTPDQRRANRLLGSAATHILLRGGARSGKTFVLVRAMVIRALRAGGTRHGIFRHRLNALRATVVADTFPAVMRACFPTVPWALSRTDWTVELPNGSSIVFGGLDDDERTEKILGLEFATVYLNEASQITYGARNMLLTRLAQKSPLALKEYVDANPPTTSHWLYRVFEEGVEPTSGTPLDRARHATMQLNPAGNRANLSAEYMAQLAALPERERRRFMEGEYQHAVDGALWRMEDFARAAAITPATRGAIAAHMRRIVVAVDPSGCSGPEDMRSDEIGIVVCGVDAAGAGHVLADLSRRDSPAGWARAALQAQADWGAERIVAEQNFGGALVEATLRGLNPNAALTMVSASRGKAARAEPVAALYEQGRVTHHGTFAALETQLCQFSASGYHGAQSPDRADALVWALSDLMLAAPPAAPARWVPTRFNMGR
ncbi:phage DNA packaging protein [Gluconacetobacter sp. SXCC-1]|uniref:phage terminase large subunit n=1 Tax=Komagataeibacter rhaeticus TaxID=215221 RepID=UPI0002080634|nr:phage terminase large subunit [Komagataeibacter rhaeticus]EGG76794.1 phage DNA packaging protein [Gluconacetobacter sp. SXCC-1]QOC47898.1 DNA packaging protein [Komagataeibacter rhaeticus]WPP22722.1 phage terminase large subunit [Komagataeibacter rhaeticus]SAY48551.1 Terminase-like family protein [Komagataeibacter rhaeticus]